MALDEAAATAQLLQLLRGHWGHDAFRPLQREAILGTLQGRDVLLLLPTGGGKSVVYQLPVLTRENAFTVVVTPLLALAKDQVEAAQDRGIEAELWNSTVPEARKAAILSDIASGEPCTRLLYVTPESLTTDQLREGLREAHANGSVFSLAVDEAHCASVWGNDFRPSYLRVGDLRALLPGVPVVAVTATATDAVASDIGACLGLAKPLMLKGSFNRPNIRYEVRYKELLSAPAPEDDDSAAPDDDNDDDSGGDGEGNNAGASASGRGRGRGGGRYGGGGYGGGGGSGRGGGDDAAVLADLLAFLSGRRGQSGVVYCGLRSTCDWLARQLQDAGVDAEAYHAGRDADARGRVQREWMDGSTEVVVATIAFGMGLDKSAVRYVVHWNVSKDLEGLYQESGRAGRDGLPSHSLVYASTAELRRLQSMERGQRAGATGSVAAWALEPGCRRRKLLAYFSERRGGCGEVEGELPCDWCTDSRAVLRALSKVDAKAEASIAEKIARQMRGGGGGDRALADPFDRDESGVAATCNGGSADGSDGGDDSDEDGGDGSSGGGGGAKRALDPRWKAASSLAGGVAGGGGGGGVKHGTGLPGRATGAAAVVGLRRKRQPLGPAVQPAAAGAAAGDEAAGVAAGEGAGGGALRAPPVKPMLKRKMPPTTTAAARASPVPSAAAAAPPPSAAADNQPAGAADDINGVPSMHQQQQQQQQQGDENSDPMPPPLVSVSSLSAAVAAAAAGQGKAGVVEATAAPPPTAVAAGPPRLVGGLRRRGTFVPPLKTKPGNT